MSLDPDIEHDRKADIDRPALLLQGKEGKERSNNVWWEIVEALKKDVPGITQYIM